MQGNKLEKAAAAGSRVALAGDNGVASEEGRSDSDGGAGSAAAAGAGVRGGEGGGRGGEREREEEMKNLFGPDFF